MKPTTTAKLALSLIDIVKAGALLFLFMVIEWNRSKQRHEVIDAKTKEIDNRPDSDPRDIIERHLSGK